MRHQITETVDIPEGFNCAYSDGVLTCTKNGKSLSKRIMINDTTLKVEKGKVVFDSHAGNKNTRKIILSNVAHVQNMFRGLENEFTYKLEACNVHFPMTVKVDGEKLIINNFLGEKTPRVARILPSVHVKVTGTTITITSNDRDLAGQTAANLERATKVLKRDRRIFQDGIFITEKPRRAE